MPPKKSKAAQNKGKPSKAAEDAPNNTAEVDPEATQTQEVEAGEESKGNDAPPAEETEAASAPSEGAEEPESKTQENPAPKSKKRKADGAAKEPAKASRQSIRGASKTQPTHLQLLNFLLSDAAADMCRPDDEIKDLEQRGKDIKTYSSSALSPFEELLCAIVLSRPISHRLGLRTIRTILNEPYGFTSPKAIKAVTPEQRHQAMFDAKTQHKDKTATQIGLVANVIASDFGKDDSDTSLDKLRSKAKNGWDEERDLLQSSIKGLGKTGLDIFFRRVQWLWPEAFPFVDERTGRGIEKLGLPKNPDELLKVLNDNWSKLDTSGLAKANRSDKESAKRRAFVVICERATGADLEGKTEALIEAAATS